MNMSKIFLNLFFSFLVVISTIGGATVVRGQTNISPLAVISGSNCSTGPCSAINNLVFGTCGTQEMWVSTSSPPSSTPGVDWIQWDWPSTRSFNQMVIHHAQSNARFLTGALIQLWNGTAWVNHYTFSNLPMQCINTVTFPTATAARMRITAFQMTGTGQTSNPNFREIEVIEAATGPNNAGVTSIVSPDTVLCRGNYDIKAIVSNFGTNNITTVTLNWSINGTIQTPVVYNGTLVPSSVTGTNSATVTLGNRNIQTTSVIKVWSSMPNNVVDTNRNNDTATLTVTPIDFEINRINDTVCTGASVLMSVNPTAPSTATSMQWYTSTSGNPYSPISGATNNAYTLPNASGSANFYARFNLGTNICYTDTLYMGVIQPSIVTTIDSGRCEPGSLFLQAIGNPGSTIKWYESATSTTPIHTGDTFTTPALLTSTTYWAEASVGGGLSPDSIANPIANASTTGVGQIMFSADFASPVKLNSLGVRVTNTINTAISFDVYYRPDDYRLVAGGNTSNAGWTLLSSRTNLVSAGASDYSIIADNLNLQIPASSTYSFYVVPVSANHQYATTANNAVVVSNADVTIKAGHRGSTLFSVTTTGGVPAIKMTYDKGSDCASQRRPVVASISSSDFSVDLGPDLNVCVDSASYLFLDARNPGNDYVWDNAYNGQVRPINQSGTYWVEVTNPIGCKVSDTVTINLKYNPTIDLGSDVYVCENSVVQLNSNDNGIQRIWNTGATDKIIDVRMPGTYVVTVIGQNGCNTSDSVNVYMQGEMPPQNNVRARNLNAYTFKFEPIVPAGNVTYRWDFGDGTYSFATSPIHTYPRHGNFVVTVNVNSDCGTHTDTLTVHVLPTSIDELLSENDFTIYPNPASQIVNFKLIEGNKISDYEVVDVQGRTVIAEKDINRAEVEIDVTKLSNGLYFIKSNTEQGIIRAKFNVLK
jgi:hypothetical protein